MFGKAIIRTPVYSSATLTDMVFLSPTTYFCLVQSTAVFSDTPNIRQNQSKSLTASLNKQRIKNSLHKNGRGTVRSLGEGSNTAPPDRKTSWRHGPYTTLHLKKHRACKLQQLLQLIPRLQRGNNGGYVVTIRRDCITIVTEEQQ